MHQPHFVPWSARSSAPFAPPATPPPRHRFEDSFRPCLFAHSRVHTPFSPLGQLDSTRPAWPLLHCSSTPPLLARTHLSQCLGSLSPFMLVIFHNRRRVVRRCQVALIHGDTLTTSAPERPMEWDGLEWNEKVVTMPHIWASRARN